jgi:NAD(P)-dependent dehydrogenase (short-subunit alcohol dehydrogenase family)
MGRLEKRVAIISGGNRGIGAAIAERFASEGATVVILGRDAGRAEGVISNIHGAGGQAMFVWCDVTDMAQCESAVQQVVDAYGQIDCLVNNAGVIYRNKSVVDTSMEEWKQTFDVNVNGTFYLSKFAMPHLEHTQGTVVNMASYIGLVGFKGAAAYCASKGAIVQLTRAMALDHAAAGVRVNCVCPGSVHTEMITSAWEQYGEGAEEVWSSKHPLGRIAQPSEIADAVVYLASNESSFLTGVALPVDGGITAG